MSDLAPAIQQKLDALNDASGLHWTYNEHKHVFQVTVRNGDDNYLIRYLNKNEKIIEKDTGFQRTGNTLINGQPYDPPVTLNINETLLKDNKALHVIKLQRPLLDAMIDHDFIAKLTPIARLDEALKDLKADLDSRGGRTGTLTDDDIHHITQKAKKFSDTDINKLTQIVREDIDVLEDPNQKDFAKRLNALKQMKMPLHAENSVEKSPLVADTEASAINQPQTPSSLTDMKAFVSPLAQALSSLLTTGNTLTPQILEQLQSPGASTPKDGHDTTVVAQTSLPLSKGSTNYRS